MGSDDPLRERETQPGAGWFPRSRRVGPIEAVEDLRQLGRSDPDPGIADPQNDELAFALHDDRHRSLRAVVGDGVEIRFAARS